MFVVRVVCCQVEVSATSRSLVQRSPIECDVSECDLENLVNEEVLAHWNCCAKEKKNVSNSALNRNNIMCTKVQYFVSAISIAVTAG